MATENDHIDNTVTTLQSGITNKKQQSHLLLLLIILLCVTALSTIYGLIEISSLAKQVNNLKLEATQSITDPTPEAIKTSSASYKLAYGKQPPGETIPINNGSVTITSALYASRSFGDVSWGSADNIVIAITINNDTKATQVYPSDIFSVQLPGGVIISPNDLVSSGQHVTVVSGGHVDEVLIYSTPSSMADVPGNGYLLFQTSQSSSPVKAKITFKKPM